MPSIGVTRNKVIVRLKAELDAAIELVSHSRECLTNELKNSEWADKKISIDQTFLKKLKELTAAFNSLTDSKIRLDKAEKAVEKDMTPEEEADAVRAYLRDLDAVTLAHFLASV